ATAVTDAGFRVLAVQDSTLILAEAKGGTEHSVVIRYVDVGHGSSRMVLKGSRCHSEKSGQWVRQAPLFPAAAERLFCHPGTMQLLGNSHPC
ncbi:MAG TPA: hypothetical protein VF783_26960, partial [Terriglobales bacterium]